MKLLLAPPFPFHFLCSWNGLAFALVYLPPSVPSHKLWQGWLLPALQI